MMPNTVVPLAASAACNRTREGQRGKFSGQHIVVDIAMEKRKKSLPFGGSSAVPLNGNEMGNGWDKSSLSSIARHSCGATPTWNVFVKKVGQRRRMDHRFGEHYCSGSEEDSGPPARSPRRKIKVGIDCGGSSVGMGRMGCLSAQLQAGDVGGVPNELDTLVCSTCVSSCVYDSIYEKDRDWPRRNILQDGSAWIRPLRRVIFLLVAMLLMVNEVKATSACPGCIVEGSDP